METPTKTKVTTQTAVIGLIIAAAAIVGFGVYFAQQYRVQRALIRPTKTTKPVFPPIVEPQDFFAPKGKVPPTPTNKNKPVENTNTNKNTPILNLNTGTLNRNVRTY